MKLKVKPEFIKELEYAKKHEKSKKIDDVDEYFRKMREE